MIYEVIIMLENTLYKALNAYRIELALEKNHYTDNGIRSIMNTIDQCQSYLKDTTNKVDGNWMEKNANLLSKAVKYAYNIKCNDIKDDTDIELQELKKCIEFFKMLYERYGVDY